MRFFTVENVTISPVAVRFENAHVDSLQELVILYKDGGEYIVFSDDAFVNNTTYGLGGDKDATYTFNRIVDVENISGVIVNGEIFPVE